MTNSLGPYKSYEKLEAYYRFSSPLNTNVIPKEELEDLFQAEDFLPDLSATSTEIPNIVTVLEECPVSEKVELAAAGFKRTKKDESPFDLPTQTVTTLYFQPIAVHTPVEMPVIENQAPNQLYISPAILEVPKEAPKEIVESSPLSPLPSTEVTPVSPKNFNNLMPMRVVDQGKTYSGDFVLIKDSSLGDDVYLRGRGRVSHNNQTIYTSILALKLSQDYTAERLIYFF